MTEDFASATVHRAYELGRRDGCPHCADKDERIAWLESELGLRRDMDFEDRLRTWLRANGVDHHARGSARIVAALYLAKGRTVTLAGLLEVIPPRGGLGGDDDRTCSGLRVWISRARRALGAAAIGTVWAQGYKLTPEGMVKVAAILGR